MPTPTVKGKRILLADDDPSVRNTYGMLLEVDGHRVTAASDGAEALAIYEPGEFDLVITDYAMPVMKGDQLAASIKRIHPAQRILMITAFYPGEDLQVDRILHKPFDLPALREAIAQALG